MKFLYGFLTLSLTIFSLIVVYLFVINVEEDRGNPNRKKVKDLEPILGVVYGRNNA